MLNCIRKVFNIPNFFMSLLAVLVGANLVLITSEFFLFSSWSDLMKHLVPPLSSSTFFEFSTRVSLFSVPLSLRLRHLEFASSPGELVSLNGRHACFNFLADLLAELQLDIVSGERKSSKLSR